LNGQVVDPVYRKTSPDHIFVQGALLSGAIASIAYRKTREAAEDIGFRWIITGIDGELILSAPERWWQNGLGTPDGWSLKLRAGKEGNLQEISLEDLDNSPASSVKSPGTNTARLYQSFAHGHGLEATFESAAKTHRLLDRIAKSAGWNLV
jgi:predicted dehydrogenase